MGGESIFFLLVGFILGLFIVMYRARHWRVEIDEREVEIDKLKSSNKKKDAKVKKIEKSLEEYENSIEDISSQLRYSKEERHNLTNQVNEMNQYCTRADALVQNLKARSVESKKNKEELTLSLNKRYKELDILKSHIKEREDTIGQMQGQTSEMMEQIQDLTIRGEERDRTIGQLQAAVKKRDIKIQELMINLEHANEKMTELDNLIEKKDQDISTREARMDAMQDNFAIISGIGPKMSSVLRNAGIASFPQLAGTKIKKIRNILEAENPSLLRLVDPTSWSKQAKLAASGEWEALKDFKESLKEKQREEKARALNIKQAEQIRNFTVNTGADGDSSK